MRRFFALTMFLLLFAAISIPLAEAGSPDAVRSTFTVEGMHCDGCSSAITAVLEKFDGVSKASADHEAGVAEATYNPRKAEVEELKAAIEKLGYTVIKVTTEVVEG